MQMIKPNETKQNAHTTETNNNNKQKPNKDKYQTGNKNINIHSKQRPNAKTKAQHT